MNVIFVGVFYYQGPVRHLFNIFHKYKKIADVFEKVGINCCYFSRQNEILPQDKILTEEQFYKMLPETDLIFMWNGQLAKEKEIAEKCRQQGTPIYFMELGWLPQMNTFYFDRKGVNYGSTLTDWQYEPLSDEDKKYVNAKLVYYHQKIARFTGLKFEDDFVFVPLQVNNDSQIKIYSPHIKNMQQLIDIVVKYVPGKIIFKKHPKDDPGELKFPARCELYSSGTTHDFLTQCKYVVTINSTVGVEALTYNLPVITLGQAFYEKLAFPATKVEQMKDAVSWAEMRKVDCDKIQSFLCQLFKKQWHISELDKPEKVSTLIDGLTE